MHCVLTPRAEDTGSVASFSPKTRFVMQEPKELFGDFLRRERRKSGLTQIELADKWGKSQTSVSDYENHRRVIDREDALPLADALNLTQADVLEAAGFQPDEPGREKTFHRYVIGEFGGKPVEVMLRSTPSEEQLQRFRLAASLIFAEDKKGSGR